MEKERTGRKITVISFTFRVLYPQEMTQVSVSRNESVTWNGWVGDDGAKKCVICQ